MKIGFRTSVISGIQDSLSFVPNSLGCIPDSKAQDFEFHRTKFPSLPFPGAKIYWNPESGIRNPDSLTRGDWCLQQLPQRHVPTTLRKPFLDAFARRFDTSQVYSPESDLVTLLILKFPLDRMRCLPESCTSIGPNRHLTVGFGSPVGLQISSTLVWTRACRLDCGALLPVPNPAGISAWARTRKGILLTRS